VQPQGESSWAEQERQQALNFLKSLPAQDRVLLLRTDADLTPLVPFTTDRAALRQAITNAEPTSTVPDLPRALALGKAALSGSRGGLLAYIGPGMSRDEDVPRLHEIVSRGPAPNREPQMKVLLVGRDHPIQDVGVVGLGLQRDATNPQVCHLLGAIRNYGQRGANVTLTITLDGRPAAQQSVAIAAGESVRVHAAFVAPNSGVVEAAIDSSDALTADNRAELVVPPLDRVRVAVLSGDAEFYKEMKAVFAADPQIAAEVTRTGTDPSPTPEIRVLLARSAPAHIAPNSIVFLRGAGRPGEIRLAGWNSEHPVTQWLNTPDITLRNWTALHIAPGDTILATASSPPYAPLIVAREQHGEKSLLLGFDPSQSNLSTLSAFPLLMAGAVEWMLAPSPAVVASAVPGNLDITGAFVKVADPASNPVPVRSSARGVQFFAPTTGLYRLSGEQGERRMAVNAPPLPMRRWEPAVGAQDARSAPLPTPSGEWWKWLVLLAVVALWMEWILFYPGAKLSRTLHMFWRSERKTAGPGKSDSHRAGILE
jgi:hypothetical protein